MVRGCNVPSVTCTYPLLPSKGITRENMALVGASVVGKRYRNGLQLSGAVVEREEFRWVESHFLGSYR